MDIDLRNTMGYQKEFGLSPFQQGWLIGHYLPEYQLADIRRGRYGLVFICDAKDTRQYPQRLASKTVDLAKMANAQVLTSEHTANFEREINIWMSLPPHNNVVPALQLDFLPVADDNFETIGRVPLVLMPYCESSLANWIEDYSDISTFDKCAALAFMCNGLSWLYKHGIHEHGDLKPDNVLIRDLRTTFGDLEKEPGWPTGLGPWMARIADLGWANAWHDLGLSDKSFRPYLAPERYFEEVRPVASDIFAVGIMICELFGGSHPAGRKTSELKNWNRSKWQRWALEGPRHLPELIPDSLRDITLACLDSDPSLRPNPQTIIDSISTFTLSNYRFDLALHCRLMNQEVEKGEVLHAAWAPHQIASMGPAWIEKEILRLEQVLGSIDLSQGRDQIGKWLLNWQSLVSLRENRAGDQDIERVRTSAYQARDILEKNWNDDFRPVFYPHWDNCSLDPREVLYDYSQTVIRLLENHDPSSIGQLRDLNMPISLRYAEHRVRQAEWLREILSRPDED